MKDVELQMNKERTTVLIKTVLIKTVPTKTVLIKTIPTKTVLIKTVLIKYVELFDYLNTFK